MCPPQNCVHEVKYNHLFGFEWEVRQMTKVRSCERFQRRCRCSKVLEGLWLVRQAQATSNCGFRSAGLSCALACDISRITLFILVLVRGSVLKVHAVNL